MYILKRDNVERIVLAERDKNRLIALGYTDITPQNEEQQEKKSKKKKVEGAN